MAKIYTKTGDKGTTSLVDGKRVSKTHQRLEAYGTVDELNSVLGLLTTKNCFGQESTLEKTQNNLFNIGSNLATENQEVQDKLPSIDPSDVGFLEEQIDEMNQSLPELKSFVLPGGNEASALSHMARTICRRAERRVVGLEEDSRTSLILQYLNRLSDYFFVLSRFVLHQDGGSDVIWTK